MCSLKSAVSNWRSANTYVTIRVVDDNFVGDDEAIRVAGCSPRDTQYLFTLSSGVVVDCMAHIVKLNNIGTFCG